MEDNQLEWIILLISLINFIFAHRVAVENEKEILELKIKIINLIELLELIEKNKRRQKAVEYVEK